MILQTDSKRVEVEYTRGSTFFVRFPLLGEVLWTRAFGWESYSRPMVKATLHRQAEARRAADAALDVGA
jgi:hypothetical protein